MLRQIAEYKNVRYHLLLVDEFDAMDQWPAGAAYFSLFIYLDEDVKSKQAIAPFKRFAKSALLAGVKSVYCCGLMASWLDDLFDYEEMFLKWESNPDTQDEEISSDDDSSDDIVMTYFNTRDFDMDELVWEFMSITSATELFEPHIWDKVAIFKKSDPNWKRYRRSLRIWTEKGL